MRGLVDEVALVDVGWEGLGSGWLVGPFYLES